MTPSLSTAPTPLAKPTRRFQLDSRFIAPILITTILIGGQLSFKILESFPRTALCILVSIVTELVLGLLITRKMPHLASAYVSGISCGILIRSPHELWPYIIAPMLSITSKYVIRWNGRHLWNPSNLAIAALLFIAPDTVSTLSIQWGNSHWPMMIIWTLGSIIVYRLGRFPIVATYVLSFFGFALLRAVMADGGFEKEEFFRQVAPITGPMYQLFIFFMITDPKTTVHNRKGQMLVAFLIALAESLIRFYGPKLGFIEFASHAPYYALTFMGPSANIIEIAATARARRRAPILATA
jgi:Na+-translocating ferredoxin:NAD+ oxidoreductase RnfD subunit